MKKGIFLASLSFAILAVSCKKNECAMCHYDKNGAEVELGEYCGDDISNLEKNGYNDNGTIYTAHCGEH